jgi:hypothetical protein
MSRIRVLISLVLVVLLAAVLYVCGMVFNWYGELEDSGRIQALRTPDVSREQRANEQIQAAAEIGVEDSKQILFGDLHVHTTFSSDAFLMSLPMVQGEGAHPPADACDFARVCSALDFWALTDHAESLTQARWQEAIASVQQCNAIAGDAQNPDMVTFMGFEWTQAGSTPETHYGHKNVIFKDTGPENLPARPIGSPFREAFSSTPLKLRLLPPLRDLPNRQRYYDFAHLLQTISRQAVCPEGVSERDLPRDCMETAATPDELFRKLADWNLDSIVIPHGTSWGIYTPAGYTLDKQLAAGMTDPQRQFLIEVYSGHGSSEQYRDWKAVDKTPDGELVCPAPTADYLPSCWRAGEIIRERCTQAKESPEECAARAADARQRYVRYGQLGWHTVPGVTPEDWLDSGQCRDCFLPAFNYRPGGSAQYGLAITNFDDPEHPARFRFGFIASSDNHSARPGTGYKQYARKSMTDSWGYAEAESRQMYSTDRREPAPASVDVDTRGIYLFNILEMERQASFFSTGGLVAVHAEGRDRNSIWQALKRKEVYGTSGQRLLLWFDLINPPAEAQATTLPMGAETRMDESPRFRVRALGAFEQKPGCPEFSLNAMPHERLELLCRGECYNPSNKRQAIDRIEVIRIRPQNTPGEPVGRLIEDPWKTLACDSSPSKGCEAEFSDPEFATGGRDTVYYVRAIQASQGTINAGNLRCERDEQGQCIAVKPCYGDDRTSADDNCLAPAEHRAWSSPIFIDFRPRAAPES